MKRHLKVGFLLSLSMFALLLSPGSMWAQGTTQNVTLTLSEFTISPNTITVTQGQPVHFTLNNTGKFPHTIAFMQGSQMVTITTSPVPGGQSATADFTFSQAGTWEMHCPVDGHASKGMTGQVTVLAAIAPGMPVTGAAADQSPLVVGGIVGLALLAGGLIARRRRADRAS